MALGKVVDVKEIVLDSFARSLADFPGAKTPFPERLRRRHRSIVTRPTTAAPTAKESRTQAPGQTHKKSIFQRMRSKAHSTKRKATAKAPVRTPFGSNLANMADEMAAEMDDIIIAMVNSDEPGAVNQRRDSDIITATEFRQIFSHSFVCTGLYAHVLSAHTHCAVSVHG